MKFKYLGLYFTADWCSACVRLGRTLPSLLNRVNQGSDLFKLITFRLDESDSDFAYKYYKFKNCHMGQASHLADMLAVRFLPTVLVYNIEGRLVSRSGVQDMQKHGEKTINYWDTLWNEWYFVFTLILELLFIPEFIFIKPYSLTEIFPKLSEGKSPSPTQFSA